MWTIVGKDLRLWLRVPQSVAVTILMPMIVLTVAAFVGSVGSGLSIVVDDSQPREVQRIVEEDPYTTRLTASGPEEARAMVREGEASGAIIVSGWDQPAQPAKIELVETDRGDFDLHRNLVLRVNELTLDANQQWLAAQDAPRLTIRESGLLSGLVPNSAYFAAGIVIFTAIFGGLGNTVFLTAREWDESVARASLVSPRSYADFVLAKIVGGSVQTALAVLVVFAIVAIAFGVRPAGSVPLLTALLAGSIVIAASIGALLGVAVRTIIPAVMASAVLSSVAWFIGGGFGPAAFTHPTVQWFSWKLPTTYAITSFQKLMQVPATDQVRESTFLVVIGAVVTFVVCIGLGTRMLARDPLHGGRS